MTWKENIKENTGATGEATVKGKKRNDVMCPSSRLSGQSGGAPVTGFFCIVCHCHNELQIMKRVHNNNTYVDRFPTYDLLYNSLLPFHAPKHV